MPRRPATASLVDPKTGKIVALDALLDEVSAAGIGEQRRVYAVWRERFHAETPLASLRAQDAADWRLIDNQIGLSFLEFDHIQNYKHSPTVYAAAVS